MTEGSTEGRPTTLAQDSSEYRTTEYKWPYNTITWSFADFIIDADPRQDLIGVRGRSVETDKEIRDAFKAWEEVCGIDFREVSDGRNVDIRVGWMRLPDPDGEDGTTPVSDGSGMTLGLSQPYPSPSTATIVSNLILLDPADFLMPDPADITRFVVNPAKLVDMYDTMLHEVGHALGLDHSDVPEVVMSGYSPTGPTPYWDPPGRDSLQTDDIAGAVALWGRPDGSGGPPPPPSGTPTRGDDTLIGTEDPDSIDGGAGDDFLVGRGGNDALQGGVGNDTIQGGDGNDTLLGGEWSDGEEDSNTLEGGAGHDYITAGDGLYAGSDTLVFRPGHGNDTVTGNWGDPEAMAFYGDPEKIVLSGFGDRAPSWMEIRSNLSADRGHNELGTPASSVRLDLTDFGGGTITFWNVGIEYIDPTDFIGLTPERGPGTPGPDTLIGTDGNDSLDGLGGDDALVGLAGNDILIGGAGDDCIWGGRGADQLYGGSGNDCIFGQEDDDSMDGGDHNDTILGGDGNDTIEGRDGADLLWGESGRDSIDGGSGNDFVAGGAGADTLLGGGGIDYLLGGSGDDVLDSEETSSSYDFLVGGPGDDTLHGGRVGDTFWGGEGEDRFVLQAATTEVPQAGEPEPPDEGPNVSWIMDFEPGLDEIEAPGLPDLTLSTAHLTQLGDHVRVDYEGGAVFLAWTTIAELQLAGGEGNDTIHGTVGHDSLLGFEGDDSLLGNSGADTIDGGSGHDTLEGGPGDDSLTGGSGRDSLTGGDGADFLDGGTNYDALDGGPGDDTLIGGRVGDTLWGGEGEDRFELVEATTEVPQAGAPNVSWIMDFDPGLDEIVAPGFTNLASAHLTQQGAHVRLDFENGAVYLANKTIAELRLAGGEGNDTIDGTAGHDSLQGFEGNDSLLGNSGADTIDGGSGHDTLEGGPGDDSLFGGHGSDSLTGGDGADTLVGGTSPDTLVGGLGDDSLSGGDGRDLLTGGAGDDTLEGGSGDNTLVGGSGDDRFVLQAGTHWILDYLDGYDEIVAPGLTNLADHEQVTQVEGGVRVGFDEGAVYLVGRTLAELGWTPPPTEPIDWF